MNATDLDLPVLPSADQIRRREFATVRRGYDPDQVRDYLSAVAEAVETLERQLRETKLELQAALQRQREARPDPYREVSERLAELLRSADQQAERIVREAQEEARRMVEEARAEADRIRLDAQARAEEARQRGHEALERAREEADRMLSGLAERRRSLVEQLRSMQERLIDVARELEVAIDPAADDPGARAVVRPAAEEPSPAPSAAPGSAAVEPRADAAAEDLWGDEDTVDLSGLEVPPLDLGLEDEED
jgi:cell division initiation protein